MFGAYLIDRL